MLGASRSNEYIMGRVCELFLPTLAVALDSGDSALEESAAGALMGYSQLDDKTKVKMALNNSLVEVLVRIIC